MDTDQIIERALSSYSNVAPPAGLPQRVWNRIHHAETSRRRSRALAGWSIGLAAAALLIMTSLPKRAIPSVPVPSNPVISASAVQSASVAVRKPVRKRRSNRVSDPMRLSGEEFALLELVQHHPAAVRLALADIPLHPIEPIEVTPIAIEPLPGSDPH